MRAARERHEALWEWECAEITRLFRAVIDGDREEFLSALAELHPAEEQRITALILLKNLAQKICEGEGNNDFSQDELVAPQLSAEDRAALWHRFAPLHAQLQSAEEDQFIPGFQSSPNPFFFEELPSEVTVEGFVQGWAGGAGRAEARL